MASARLLRLASLELVSPRGLAGGGGEQVALAGLEDGTTRFGQGLAQARRCKKVAAAARDVWAKIPVPCSLEYVSFYRDMRQDLPGRFRAVAQSPAVQRA